MLTLDISGLTHWDDWPAYLDSSSADEPTTNMVIVIQHARRCLFFKTIRVISREKYALIAAGWLPIEDVAKMKERIQRG
jgi:hypothetical protein